LDCFDDVMIVVVIDDVEQSYYFYLLALTWRALVAASMVHYLDEMLAVGTAAGIVEGHNCL
jgi:hypothetical protein